MIRSEFRMFVAPWRSIAGYPLIAVVMTCCAQSACADDNGSELAPWRYRDYLLYSAPPSLSAFRPIIEITPVKVGDFLHRRNIDSGSASSHLLLSAGFDTRADWESIRYGLGVCADLPESGQFHFNLYVRPNAQRPGLRWQLQPTGLPIVTSAGHQNWSIGGFVDYSRAHDDQRGRVGIAPQLILNLSPLLQLPGDAQASVQYAYWRSTLDTDAAQNRALQLALRWKF